MEPCASHGSSVRSDESVALCPESRTAGSSVGLITLKAILTANALRRLEGSAFYFCGEVDCDVVYFDNVAGSVFRKPDLRTRVGLKETVDPIPLCYCFDLTMKDVREEIEARGATDAPARITAEIQAGHCACEVRNPRGACCLGELSGAVRVLGSASSRFGASPHARPGPAADRPGYPDRRTG